MGEVFDIYTIIFLGLAVFIFMRLRSVLGQKTGDEPRPPNDLFRARDSAPPPATPAAEKVVTLPARGGTAPVNRRPDGEAPGVDRWRGVAEPGTPLAAALDAIVRHDPNFTAKEFIDGARAAYEMIVVAYASGDRKTLRMLLSKDVYESFVQAITEREARGEVVETRFVAIDASEIVRAEVQGTNAHVTVRFASQLITTTKDRSGAIVDGNADGVTDTTDVWTFARDVASRDPNWRLIATTEPV